MTIGSQVRIGKKKKVGRGKMTLITTADKKHMVIFAGEKIPQGATINYQFTVGSGKYGDMKRFIKKIQGYLEFHEFITLLYAIQTPDELLP